MQVSTKDAGWQAVGQFQRLMASTTKPLLLLVDGHSLAFRSFYAFSKGGEGGLSTQDGVPTSVTYGFLKALLDNCKSLKPQGVVIAFDTAEPTFRHKADETYKANRDVAPDHFFQDVDNLQEILKGCLDIPLCLAPGYEADDVLGTLANRGANEGWRVRILSGDRDLFQLVDDQRDIAVLYMGGGPYAKSSGPTEIREEGVVSKLGVMPNKVVDLKALTGDSSDNIPGVRGVGPKTAINLLSENGDLDGVYTALEALSDPKASSGALKGALKGKLSNDKENAYRSRMLAEILVDIPLPEDPRLGLGLVELGACGSAWKSWSSTACSARAKSLPSCFRRWPTQPRHRQCSRPEPSRERARARHTHHPAAEAGADHQLRSAPGPGEPAAATQRRCPRRGHRHRDHRPQPLPRAAGGLGLLLG